MIDQLTVFLENKTGRLTALCKALGDAQINMNALSVADTADYGVARIICNNPARAAEVLKEAGFRASTTKVVAVEVPDVPGALAGVFQALEDRGINVQYSYCFAANGKAVDALKAPEEAIAALSAAGYSVLHQADLA
ncbi:MAG: ACT domain-containing protein [Coriobacteriales bacterium]